MLLKLTLYTVKEDYQWLRAKQGSGDITRPWSSLWKIQAPEKVRFFFWLAWHDSLPTLQTLYKRGIVQSPVCSRCGAGVEESVIHCIRDCNVPRQMWQNLGFGNSTFFQHDGFLEWQQNALSGDRPSLFITGSWTAWCMRNTKCLGGVEDTPMHKIVRDVIIMGNAIDAGFKLQATQSRPQRWITWHPVRDSRMVLNVDGSAQGNSGPAGYGGLLRIGDGE